MTNATAAGTWTLGDLTVNRMGLGAMRLTGDGPRDRAIAVLRRAVELGVNHIDTASFYFSAMRSANELINSALSPYPDDLVITTKVWPGRDPSGDWMWAETPAKLRGQVEENLRQLGRDYLDVVNLRVPPSQQAGSLAAHFAALAELRDQGLIRHLGISNITSAHLAEARAVAPVVCVQNRFALGAEADQHEMLRSCGELGIAYVPFFALASATDSAEVDVVARAHGATPAQVRLAWTLQLGQHVLAIPGTGDPAHLEDNVAAATLTLTPAEMSLLGQR
jgi:pyridoxine 4-dehydrogenase